MARLTQLDRPALDEIARKFALDILSARHIEGGAKNTSYLITAKTGRFVATVLEHQDLAFAEAYGSFLQQIVDRGLPTPSPRRTLDERWSCLHDDKPIILTAHVEGSNSSALNQTELFRLGILLARIHNSGLDRAMPPTVRLSNDDILWLTESDADPFARWALERHQQTAGAVQSKEPRQLTHGDPFRDNVLVTESGGLVLVDWEEAASDIPAIDLAMATLSHCCDGDVDPARVECLARGYASGSASSISVATILQTAAYAGLIVAYRRYRRYLAGLTTADTYLSMQKLVDMLSGFRASRP